MYGTVNIFLEVGQGDTETFESITNGKLLLLDFIEG